MNYAFRPMVPADAPCVSSILRDAFDKSLHRYIAYCQPGLPDYLADGPHGGASAADGAIQQVATDSTGRVVGYAKITGGGAQPATLSYLSVDATHRRHGIARALIAAAAGRLGELSTVEVDVFATNEPALRFYGRLGATSLNRTCWWAAESRAVPRASSDAILEDPVATRTALERYGFCQAVVTWASHRRRLNLPSRSVLRLPDITGSTLNSTCALDGLTRITTFLAVAPDSPERTCGGEWHRVVESVRLRIRPPLDGEHAVDF